MNSSGSNLAFAEPYPYASTVGIGNSFSEPIGGIFTPDKSKWVDSEQEAKSLAKIPLMIPAETVLPGDPKYKLNSPVNGVIEYTIDGVLITVHIFDEEGYGETYESAWDDLLSSIRDRYASLVKREQGLSPPDHIVLCELRRYLSEAAQ